MRRRAANPRGSAPWATTSSRVANDIAAPSTAPVPALTTSTSAPAAASRARSTRSTNGERQVFPLQTTSTRPATGVSRSPG